VNENLKPEAITKMSDDELVRRLEGLKRKIERIYRRGPSDVIKLCEVDYCYLYRELEIRRARDCAHADYLKANNRFPRAPRRETSPPRPAVRPRT